MIELMRLNTSTSKIYAVFKLECLKPKYKNNLLALRAKLFIYLLK